MSEDSVSLNQSVLRQDAAVKASEASTIVHDALKQQGADGRPAEEEYRQSPKSSDEDVPSYEELEQVVGLENDRLREKKIPVSLRLHRHNGKIYLQVVDGRIADKEKIRRFRVLDRNAIHRIMRDLLEGVGICLDTSA